MTQRNAKGHRKALPQSIKTGIICGKKMIIKSIFMFLTSLRYGCICGNSMNPCFLQTCLDMWKQPTVVKLIKIAKKQQTPLFNFVFFHNYY